MRGISDGQQITLLIIPEVSSAAVPSDGPSDGPSDSSLFAPLMTSLMNYDGPLMALLMASLIRCSS